MGTTRRRPARTIRVSTCRSWSVAAGFDLNVDIGTRETFADLGQTVAEVFGVGPLPNGTSFLGTILQP